MESPYDSDVSEDTRDLIARGLATDVRKHSVQVNLGSNEREISLARNMNASYVRPPLAHVVQVEELSARSHNMTCGEIVKGQNYTIGTSQVGFEGVAEPRGNRREVVKKHELSELTDEEMIRTYDELEREMRIERHRSNKRVAKPNE